MLLSKICDSMETVREIRMSSGETVRIAAQKDSENSSQKKPKDSVQRNFDGREGVGERRDQGLEALEPLMLQQADDGGLRDRRHGGQQDVLENVKDP